MRRHLWSGAALVLWGGGVAWAQPKPVEIRLAPGAKACEVKVVIPPTQTIEANGEYVAFEVNSTCDAGFQVRLAGEGLALCRPLPLGCEWTHPIQKGVPLMESCYPTGTWPEGCYKYRVDVLDSADQVVDSEDPEVDVRRKNFTVLMGGARIELRPQVGDGAERCVAEVTPVGDVLRANPGAAHWEIENHCGESEQVSLSFADELPFQCSSARVPANASASLVCLLGDDPTPGDYAYDVVLSSATLLPIDGGRPILRVPRHRGAPAAARQ